MDETNASSTNGRGIALAGAVLAAVGGVLFWTWRENAPVSRFYRRWRGGSAHDLN